MISFKRPLASAGAVALLTISLTACGGSGAPADASVADFCDAAQGSAASNEEFTAALEEQDFDKLADLLKEQVEAIEEVGTPEDIPDDAREGFEIQVDTAKEFDGDDLKAAFEAEEGEDPFEAELSEDEKEKVEAYNTYQSETCADEE